MFTNREKKGVLVGVVGREEKTERIGRGEWWGGKGSCAKEKRKVRP